MMIFEPWLTKLPQLSGGKPSARNTISLFLSSCSLRPDLVILKRQGDVLPQGLMELQVTEEVRTIGELHNGLGYGQQ